MPVTRSQIAKTVAIAFDNLPLETLHQIFGYFCVHCRTKHQSLRPDAHLRGDQQESDEPSWYSLERQTLFSLCLVSKRLCYAAQSVLYHEFLLGYGDSWRSDVYTWDGRLTSFVRTVAQRRDLAALVKRIYIHPYLLESFGETEHRGHSCMTTCELGFVMDNRHLQPRQYIAEEEAQNTLQDIAHALGIKELQRLLARDLVTVLITELPNLERCSLQVGPHFEEIVRSAALHAAGISCLPLRTLDISIRSGVICPRLFDLEDRARTLCEASPYLETLNLHMCRGIWYQTPFPSLRNVKTLCLTRSRLNDRALRGLLSSCSGLRRFYYEATRRPCSGPFYSERDGSDHFQLSDAIKYLSRHRATLESLHLDLRWRGITANPPPAVSFRDFPVLQHLFLNVEELYGKSWAEPYADSSADDSRLLVELLPPGIASLYLAGYIGVEFPRFEKSLLGLAEATSQGQFANLEQLKCDASQPIAIDNVLSTMFEAAGVCFGYDRWPVTESTLEEGDVWPPTDYCGAMPLPDEYDDPDL